jgi:hypothetical protein
MTDYSWQTLRERAAHTIGYPNAATEDRIIEVFEQNPRGVTLAVEKILSRVHAGKLTARAGWMIVTREVAEITRPAPDVTATDTQERERALDRARRWMRNAGLHLPNEAEVLDELFERTLLREFNDETTRQEILRCYRELRPLGEQVEREALERAEAWKASRARSRTRQAEAA